MRRTQPREAAEVSLALHGGESGYHAVEIAWRSQGGQEPEEIHLYFDGEPVGVSGPVVPLPPHDLATTHVISAELIFPMQLRATAGLAFGGEFGEDVSSELTTVPLEPVGSTNNRRLPSSAQIERWLRVSGALPRVVAVERGPFELIVLRDDASLELLRRMGPRVRPGASSARKSAAHFVSNRPSAVRDVDGTSTALFSVSSNVNEGGDGLRWALTRLFFSSRQQGTDEELTSAVAVAALRAAGSNRPRGVLLVRGAGPVGESQPGLDPPSIREYLATLRVPFFYWRIDESGDATPDGWGSPTPIRDLGDLGRAESKLTSAMRPQFLAWLEGSHMPDQVTTVSPAVRLAGSGLIDSREPVR